MDDKRSFYCLNLKFYTALLDQATVLLKVLILAFLRIFLAFSKVSAFSTKVENADK